MKQKDILLVVVPTFLMVVLWVAFSIYHNHVSSTIGGPLATQIEPIAGTFDTKALENLQNRDRLNPIYEKAETVDGSDSLTEEATESGDLTPTEELTPTGELTEESIINVSEEEAAIEQESL